MSGKYINCKLLYEDSVNNMNRIVQLDDGSLFTLGAIKKNIFNIGTYPMHQYIFSRRSHDDGENWTMPKMLFEMPELRDFGDISQFMISRAGYLHVFMYKIWKYNFEKNEFKGDIWHARMDDTNGTNLKIQKIECLNRYTGSLNNLVQLESGRIVVPFSTLDEKSGTFQSSTIYSDDEGATWSVSNQLSVKSEETHIESGAVEPVVAEVAPNKLVMLIRTVLGSFYYSVSSDGGASWCETKKSKIKSSNAPAVIQKLNDGRFFISWNNCNGMPMRGVRYSMARQCLHAAISDDGLKTLKGLRTIVKKESEDPDEVLNCYPFTDVGKDDDVYMRLMTVHSKDGENWPDQNVKLVKINTDFLNKSEVINDFSTCVTEKSINEKPLIEAFENNLGFASFNFPYGQKGAMSISYESSIASKAFIILSDSYIDVSSFTLEGDSEKYKKYIDENYIKIPVSIPEGEGSIKIKWSEQMTVESGGKISGVNMSKNIPGFNHIGILLYKGSIKVTGFKEHSEKAYLATGIIY